MPGWPMSLPRRGLRSARCVRRKRPAPLRLQRGGPRDVCRRLRRGPRLCLRGPDGDELPGFPVSLPIGITASVIDTGRALSERSGPRLHGIPTMRSWRLRRFGSARLMTVRTDGPSTGRGRAGVLRLLHDRSRRHCVRHDCQSRTTRDPDHDELIAFDQNGMRPGWPVVDRGHASSAGVRPGGSLSTSVLDRGRRLADRPA